MYVDPDPECDEDGWGQARSTAVAVTVAMGAFGAYVATYGIEQYLTYTDALGKHGALLQFAVFPAVIVAHEAVHAVAYRTICGLSWADIEAEVSLFDGGVDPVHYSVHPARPVGRAAYTVAVLAPTVALGVVPAAFALATGSALAMFVGVVGLALVGTDAGTLVDLWRRPTPAATPEAT